MFNLQHGRYRRLVSASGKASLDDHNVAIIAARLVTAFMWRSAWPDLIVGAGIAIMNADAAREVWTAAREEHRAVA